MNLHLKCLHFERPKPTDLVPGTATIKLAAAPFFYWLLSWILLRNNLHYLEAKRKNSGKVFPKKFFFYSFFLLHIFRIKKANTLKFANFDPNLLSLNVFEKLYLLLSKVLISTKSQEMFTFSKIEEKNAENFSTKALAINVVLFALWWSALANDRIKLLRFDLLTILCW